MDLVWRAGNMICRPRREWAAIAAEPRTIPELYTGYIAIIAGLALAVEFASGLLSGVPLGAAFGTALSGYVLALADIAVLAVVASRLAPRFGGIADLGQSFKLAAFGCTPVWLGGAFLLVPVIGTRLALAADLYGIYVFFLGIGALTGVPRERRLGYFIAVLALTLALAAALALVFGVAIGQARMTILHG
ncbi:MAG TPA: Yip1 family protein [Stellaceae bacterium]|nr:Yip1 family protein [Stellaceae bacterium]